MSVQSRDYCNLSQNEFAIQNLQIYGLREYETKPLPGCPGYEKLEPGIGNFVFSGTELRIPRAFIDTNPLQADGPTVQTGLRVGRENLIPVPDSFARKNTIRIIVKRNADGFVCDGCEDEKQTQFLVSGLQFGSNLKEFRRRIHRKAEIRNIPGFDSFRIAGRSIHSVYFVGDIENPELWTVCTKTEFCRSGFLYNKSDINVIFIYHGLLMPAELRTLRARLQKFIGRLAAE